MATLSSARKAAFQILLKIEGGNTHSDDLLRGAAVSALAPVDRNLATALVLGVLRTQLQLDGSLRPLLARPGAKLDAEVHIALRLGAYQLQHMDRIPARAAIDESVELTKHAGHRFAAGMVNAVLRKMAASGTNSPLANAEKQAYPAWMTERWAQQFGDETACAICRHGQQQPALTIRLLNPAAEAELTRAGIQLEPGELLTSARTVLAGDIAATAALREGRIRIQDEGSQLVAEIAAFVGAKSDRVLDACAAPGGKTLILAERIQQARIVACEASEPRFITLRERLAPLGNRVECRHADASAITEEVYDLVLADVPCSGTGTLGRNPEIRHRLAPDDFARQAERQSAIFSATIGATCPAGHIVYSTCSLEPEENEAVIAAALSIRNNLRIVSIAPMLEQMETAGILVPGAAAKLRSGVIAEGFLRLMPGTFGTDGFFVAVLQKIPA